ACAIRPKKSRAGRSTKQKLYELQYNGARHLFEKHPDLTALCWNGLNGTRNAFMKGARDAGARRLFFELAPLPGHLTVDPVGVNYLNSLPRTIAPYLDWAAKAGGAMDGWRQLRREIRQRKGEAKAGGSDALPSLQEPFIFVPLQVPNDSQLRLFGGAYRTVPALIEAVADAARFLPEGWHVRIKEHPSATVSFADEVGAVRDRRVYLDNTTDTFEQVKASRAVLTVNSSVGLEAMFYDKPVIAAGKCFWSLEGVTRPAQTPDDLAKVFSDPEALDFDEDFRNAFLSYLVREYYIRVDWLPDGSARMPDTEIPKVEAKLRGCPLMPGASQRAYARGLTQVA
ncbi:MAG: hypothetical protein AAFY59_18490, partial [Pseudomonadota bacterium]